MNITSVFFLFTHHVNCNLSWMWFTCFGQIVNASQCSDCTTPLLIHNIFFFGNKDKTLRIWSQCAFEEDTITLGFVYIQSVVLYEMLNFCECGVASASPCASQVAFGVLPCWGFCNGSPCFQGWLSVKFTGLSSVFNRLWPDTKADRCGLLFPGPS